MSSKFRRNFGLDIVRTIAITLVLMAHSGFNFMGIKVGELGVEFFFVLSGFLIGRILINDFSKAITTKSIYNFWIRRWYRTLPLYYLVIGFKFVFIDHSLGYKILAYVFFLQNNFVGISFMNVTWSLVIEEWFYLTMPILFFIFFRNGLNKSRLSIFLCTFILCELTLRCVWVYYSGRPWGSIAGNVPFRLDSLAIGVLLANIKVNYHSQYLFLAKGYVFIFSLVLLVVLLYLFGIANQNNMIDHLMWTRTIWFSLLSVLLCLLLPFLENNATINNVESNNAFRFLITWISILSYSVYLIHSFIYDYIYDSAHFFELSFTLKVILANILVFAFSYILYIYFEKPIMNRRDKIKIV